MLGTSITNKLCECGCGTLIPEINKLGRPARFKHGHNSRGKRSIAPDNDMIKRGDTIGFKAHGYYTRQACTNCGKIRWVIYDLEKKEATKSKPLCRSCAAKKVFKEKLHDSGWWSEEAKQKRLNHLLGKPTRGCKKGTNLVDFYGKEKATKIKQKMSTSANIKFDLHPELKINLIIMNSGENSPVWKGGISKLPYPFEFTEKLKTRIKERDGYICQLCGCSNPKGLAVHHIDYDKDNLSEDNLITLCGSCNPKVNGKRNYWTYYFRNIIRNKYTDRISQSDFSMCLPKY